MYYILPPVNDVCLILEKDIPIFNENQIYRLGDVCKYKGETYVLTVDSHQGKFDKNNWDYLRNYSAEIKGFQEVKPLQENELVRWKNIIFKVTSDNGNIKLVPIDFIPSFVEIANKKWMTENLAYDDGEGGITFNSSNNEYYYTWEAADRVAKKLGWKLPSDEDWKNAIISCGGVIEGYYNDYDMINSTIREKLNIELTGRLCYEAYFSIGREAHFWTSTVESRGDYNFSWSYMFYQESSVTKFASNNKEQYTIRLIKD